MIAAVYYGPEDLRVEQRPTPEAGAGEMVLRVDYASICATDLRILRGAHRKYSPGTVRVPGHEVVGTIAELGSGVSGGFHAGQRVFVAPNVGCGRCRPCQRGQNNLCASYDALGITLDGAFAEFVRVPAAFLEQGNVMRFDEALDGAAVALAEPFACVLRGQQGLRIGSEDVVLILGAGPIGVMHVLAARAAGAKKILVSEQSPERLRTAAAAGADRVVNFRQESLPDTVAGETDGRGADVIVVAAGVHQAMEEAPALAAIGGRINLFAGLPSSDPEIRLDANLIHYKELIVTGTTGCSTGDCRRSMELIRAGKVDLGPLVSGRYPLDRAMEAFAAVRTGNALKVVLHPSGGKGES
ncbi:MAG: alcohol dehydrogenase catalytic domain-containing protein [Candidatus Solibacter sp.]|nr:alcohol dehydrogenase catalytic domain-containing protein [Candidatus Solibacter sp.]